MDEQRNKRSWVLDNFWSPTFNGALHVIDFGTPGRIRTYNASVIRGDFSPIAGSSPKYSSWMCALRL
jgi:hypothetical protein